MDDNWRVNYVITTKHNIYAIIHKMTKVGDTESPFQGEFNEIKVSEELFNRRD